MGSCLQPPCLRKLFIKMDDKSNETEDELSNSDNQLKSNITIIDNLTTSAIKENINKFKQLGILHEIDINELSSDNNLFQNIDCVFHLKKKRKI